MIINRLLKIGLAIFSILYIGLEIAKYGIYADNISVILLVALTILYARQKENRKGYTPFFLYFLIFYTLAKLTDVVSNYYFYFNENEIDYGYFISNYLCILAYFFLILRCISTFNLKDIIKNFPVTIIILLVLSVFCVTLITETAETQLSNAEYVTEFSYNVVVMTLLSIALINYMDKDDNKSMLFFIGTMFIFFSEMLQLAYYYIADMTYLAAIYSVFLVLAFVFFYKQSKLKHQKFANYDYLNENLKA
ncbi:hypothetical protein DFQ05_2700 [Winogradskyella wandonensis]|uniref:YhhN-like protein n=1 Tax=Winogradskyella wandonensis TaxID=1442586 RepID=A0A4R1KIQ1_9FLAO|nr:hypothetical protein [Winogradskyella wandonensis]TCK64716.1 hypothetical protein DFQ05_2700 [Winogradskyella wandonensis]